MRPGLSSDQDGGTSSLFDWSAYEAFVLGISKLRNRVQGRVFQDLGLIEHWESGIQRMTAACRDHGLDAPQFEEIDTHFRVTLSAIPTQYTSEQRAERGYLRHNLRKFRARTFNASDRKAD